MSEIAIRVEQLSKLYQIGSKKSSNLRETLTGFFASKRKGEATDFWALKDVSFELKRGEVLGVVGRNGAGKSTLLKVLSRITEPTDGTIAINGRVGSLLEVGTGFHPELSGRENIFLNGSILGMKKAEIKAKFDEIVEFAGIEKFIDTPVKRYSSGMYVRLAFSVAAHLEPEILIIDEVLAVGDAAFQKKCMGKMQEVSGHGRTVLFVSHNMQAVRDLCTTGILLNSGSVYASGDIFNVLRDYQKLISQGGDISTLNTNNRRNRTSGKCLFTSFSIEHSRLGSFTFSEGEPLTIKLAVKAIEDVSSLGIYFAVRTALDKQIITNGIHGITRKLIKAGESLSFELRIDELLLRSGDYLLYIALADYECITFHDVLDENVEMPFITIQSKSEDLRLNNGFFTQKSDMKILSV